MKRRVVVTGYGAVTPLGNTADETWEALKMGKSGIGPITQFVPTSAQSSHIAAEVKGFQAEDHMTRREASKTDRVTQLVYVASMEAMKMSELTVGSGERVGVVIGSSIGGLSTLTKEHTALLNGDQLNTFMITMILANIPSAYVARAIGAKGHNVPPSSACATGSHSIGEAAEKIRHGRLDVAIAGGAESAINPLSVAGFCTIRALSTRNDAPTKASRPFDKDRDGFVIGEGAAVVVLEELEHAKSRGANILCELIGYGTCCDTYDIVKPDPTGDGTLRSMMDAWKDAELVAGDTIDYINAHATSTPAGDDAEVKGISLFWAQTHSSTLHMPCVGSTKGPMGHLLGAAGGAEAIVCIKAIETGDIPPNVNLDHEDQAFPQQFPEKVNFAPSKSHVQLMGTNITMSNSFGFGGQNATLIFRKYKG